MSATQQALLMTDGGGDPSVLLLLRADTSNGSTPVDDSIYERVPTGVTGIVLDTAAKYGTAGMAFTSLNKYLQYSDDGTWDFGADDFTIQVWCKNRSNTGDFQEIIGRASSYASGSTIAFSFRYSNVSLQFNAYSGGSSYGASGGGSQVGTGTYKHYAVVRQGNVFRIYINGVQVDSQTHAITINNPSAGPCIGRRSNGTHMLDADLDDLQVIKGICLYPDGTTFTPPGAL